MIKPYVIIFFLLNLETSDFYDVYSIGFGMHLERYISKEGFWHENFKSGHISSPDSVKMINDFLLKMKCMDGPPKDRPDDIRLIIIKNGIDTIFYHSDARFEIKGIDCYYKKRDGIEYLRMLDPYYKNDL